MMLSSEVALVQAGGAPVRPWPGRGVHARLDLVAPGTASFAVLFRADDASATAITAHLIGVPPEDVHDSDVKATAAEFANIIVGRLRNRLNEAGLQTQMPLPVTWSGDTPEGFPGPDGVTLTFNLARPVATFGLLLCVGGTRVIPLPGAA
jgi:CheY-specific phosphatase CheX